MIEEAERESKILANEINQWLVQESGSFLKEDEQMHFRSRRSIDEDEEDVRTDTNMLSEVDRLIVRRDVGHNSKKDKKVHKKKTGVPVIKKKKKKVNSGPVNKRHDKKVTKKDSSHLVKKQGSDIQTDKHHAKADKHKAKPDEISKENLVKELIGAKSRDAGVPEKAYRQLVEFIASSSQPTIETFERSSKKSDIARPSAKVQGKRKKLTKKHKRVLAVLAKMAPDDLRKYFHKKGLDRYWKVMDNIRKIDAMKQNGKEKLKAHEDAKGVKQVKSNAAPKKNKHLEKDALLKKQIKPHQKDSKKEISRQKIVKDETKRKSHKPDALLKKQIKSQQKDSKKEIFQHKMVKDEAKGKPHKPDVFQSPSKQKAEVVVAKPAKETHPKTMNQASHHDKKESQKITVEQHLKETPQTHRDKKKNLFNVVKSKDGVKAVKSSQTANVAASATSKTHEKLTALEVKQEPGMKGVKAVAAKETSSAKNVRDKAKESNDAVQGSKVVKESTSHVKIPASATEPSKVVKPMKNVANKDATSHQVNTSQSKAQEKQVTSQNKRNAMAISLPNKSKGADENPKESPRANAVTVHHAIKTTHAQQPEVRKDKKEDESSRAKQKILGSSKIDFLKEKIRKTNTLKFKVAQALLAHCETQNRLRQVFDDVNSSLKKAAALAKAIGEKFGIKQSDINNMTSEHADGAVEQFLNQLF